MKKDLTLEELKELYIKDMNQKDSSFKVENQYYKTKTLDYENDLKNIYDSKAWKLVQKYREFVVSLRPKNDKSKQAIEKNFIYKKENKDKPLIAYIIPGTQTSGGVGVVCQHANRLKKRGYNVILITEWSDTVIDWFPNQNVEIFTVDNCPSNVDIMVATAWTTAYTLAKLPAKRKFYFVQSDETRFFPKGSCEIEQARKTYEMDYEFITEAKWIKDWLKKEFNKDATLVLNGIDTDFMYPSAHRYIENRKKKRILIEGAINVPYKGMEDAFKVVDGLDCEVWCVSNNGRPKQEWHCDRFFERVPMQGMNFIYSQCDILLKMSRVEGFFGPPMEMMACKGACVVGKVSGYDEYIEDEKNALVVEMGDIKAARKAIVRLIKDKRLYNKLVNNGYKTAMKYKWDDSIDVLEKIYGNQK